VTPGGVDRCDVFHLDPSKVAALRRRLLSDASAGALAETFKLLGDPTRVRLLDALSRSELCVCDLAGLLGLSESAVSHQLRLLRGMRLVRPRREGRMVFYRLDDQHIVGLFEQGLEHVEERRHESRPRSATAHDTPSRHKSPAGADVRVGSGQTAAGADLRDGPSTSRAGADLHVRPPSTKTRARA
jgi:ArsR family transcriptional regulator, lead/cadmium/zinc/bismuth-responsive transcriptional repressor